jgi:hypothetical protein
MLWPPSYPRERSFCSMTAAVTRGSFSSHSVMMQLEGIEFARGIRMRRLCAGASRYF